jgi:DNA modification methylase
MQNWPADPVERRPIETLVPYARNSRTHSDEQVAQIAASMKEWGWTNPVLVDEAGMIIAGHGRVLAARKLGLAEVPVMVAEGWSEAQKRAYVLADNQLALNAGWDMDSLKVELQGLKEWEFDLSLLGFADLDALLADKTEGLTDPDDVPEAPVNPVTRLGDVWLLGKHRLVCGSCTVHTDVDAALQGRMADLCLTDPPYGLGGGKESGKNNYATYDDTLENLIALAAEWLPIARANSEAVVFSPGVTRQWVYPEPNWVICWFYGGGQLRSSWGFNCWQPFLCYGKDPSLSKGKGARPDAVDMNVPANAKDIDHPCPKPVKLWEWFLDRLTFSPNAVLYEPFNGSGTTLIAAETKGLSVAAVELDPRYVDVAVKRWQDFTGKTATLEGDGRTFAEIDADRFEGGENHKNSAASYDAAVGAIRERLETQAAE